MRTSRRRWLVTATTVNFDYANVLPNPTSGLPVRVPSLGDVQDQGRETAVRFDAGP